MGSIAAARRTQSSFPIYLASTNPPDLEGITSFVNQMSGAAGRGYNPAVLAKIAHVPHVTQLSTFAGLNVIPLSRSGSSREPGGLPGGGR